MITPKLVRCLATLAFATGLASSVFADEADIRKSIGALYPGAKIDAVRKAGALGLYEVQIGTELLYADEKGTYVFVGDLIDTKGRKNITEARKLKLAQIKFSDLPLDIAVKTVRGNGKRVFATFEDPNCGYCKKLAKDMVGLTDITIYTFLFPILAADSADKSRAIWCSPDRAKAWSDWMVKGIEAPASTCDDPIDKVSALGQKLGIRGTPTIIFADGNRIPSYLPVAQLEELLNKVEAGK